MSEEYQPYEEWWQECVSLEEFTKNLTYRIYLFHQNMTALNRVEETRREWMEMFVLWLEFPDD